MKRYKRYSSQAILNLEKNNGREVVNLQSRLVGEQGEPVPVVLFDKSEEADRKKQLASLDKDSRLYIVAHAYQFRAEDVKKLAEKLAIELPAQEPREKEELFSKRLHISLIICLAAKKQEESVINSLAGKLQYELAERGIYADISARAAFVGFFPRRRGKVTTELENESTLRTLGEEQVRVSKEFNAAKTLREKNKFAMEYQKIVMQKNSYDRRKQPNSKVTFRWATNEAGEKFQVAYDAYELKQHEIAYRNILETVQDLRDYASLRENDSDYKTEVAAARTLAAKIEAKANKYFNGIDKGEARTKKFKAGCRKEIDVAKETLGKDRDPLLLGIIKKLAYRIASAVGISTPKLTRRYGVNEERYKAGVFSNQTAGEQVSGRALDEIETIKPINTLR